jgi:hypothetical protein
MKMGGLKTTLHYHKTHKVTAVTPKIVGGKKATLRHRAPKITVHKPKTVGKKTLPPVKVQLFKPKKMGGFKTTLHYHRTHKAALPPVKVQLFKPKKMGGKKVVAPKAKKMAALKTKVRVVPNIKRAAKKPLLKAKVAHKK